MLRVRTKHTIAAAGLLGVSYSLVPAYYNLVFNYQITFRRRVCVASLVCYLFYKHYRVPLLPRRQSVSAQHFPGRDCEALKFRTPKPNFFSTSPLQSRTINRNRCQRIPQAKTNDL